MNKAFEKIVEWLEDYKRLKNIPEHTYENCHNATCRRKCERDGYNKAIEEFVEAVKNAVTEKDDIGAYDNPAKRICEILRIEAEQLKESGNNEM